MEILHLEDLGDTSVVSERSLGVNLVIEILFMYFQVLHLCIKCESNRTITYGDIAFKRFGGYECHLAANTVVGGGLRGGTYKI